jgi:beta-glucanase (GH16 family)
MRDSVTGNYGSGAVYGRYQRAFGYFEAKVKFPTQQGHWCAFWVYSDSQGSTNIIGGADGAEIDVMEKAWLTDRVQSALHWDGYGSGSGSSGKSTYNLGMTDGGWHIFGLDWTPTNYAFYVDGLLTWSTNAGGVSRVPSYVILSEEVGYMGNGPTVWGNGSITNAVLPDYYLVDYVRVYNTNAPAQLSCPMLLDGSNLVLSWTGAGVLQSASNLAGPWLLLTNAVSPFTNLLVPATPQQFFRLAQ